MQRPRVSGNIRAVLIATLALSAVFAPGVASAADDPEVLSTVMQDPRTMTNQRDPEPFATLRLPKGRWVARVVARWDLVGDSSVADIVCWTTITSSGELDRHTVRTMTLGPYFHDSDLTGQVTGSIAMSAAANVSQPRGGKVQVRCRNVGEDLIVLREVRIVALRAGQLTIVSPSGTSTWGSGAPHVRQLRRPGAVQVPVTSATETMSSLDLGAGAWWISAHFALRVEDNGSYIYPVNWRCRLGLDDSVDRAGGDLESYVLERNRTTATMELAARTATALPVRLRCGVTNEYPTLRVEDLRITAIKAGTLILGDGSADATWSSTGSGRPRVIHAHLPESGPIVGAAPIALVARVPLTGGKWLVTAKYQNDTDVDDPEAGPGPFPRMFCELRLQDIVNSSKTTTRAFGFGVPLQLVASTRGGTASLRCRWDADESRVARLRHIGITAVRVR